MILCSVCKSQLEQEPPVRFSSDGGQTFQEKPGGWYCPNGHEHNGKTSHKWGRTSRQKSGEGTFLVSAKKVAAERKKRKLTPDQLALLSGLSVHTIWGIEARRLKRVKRETALAILEAMKISLEEIMFTETATVCEQTDDTN